jgi:hypothetical protein
VYGSSENLELTMIGGTFEFSMFSGMLNLLVASTVCCNRLNNLVLLPAFNDVDTVVVVVDRMGSEYFFGGSKCFFTTAADIVFSSVSFGSAKWSGRFWGNDKIEFGILFSIDLLLKFNGFEWPFAVEDFFGFVFDGFLMGISVDEKERGRGENGVRVGIRIIKYQKYWIVRFLFCSVLFVRR